MQTLQRFNHNNPGATAHSARHLSITPARRIGWRGDERLMLYPMDNV
jgi:hypothetical protein